MSLVFRAHPADDPLGTALGVLTEASAKSIVVERNGPGSGAFTLNRHSSEAAWSAAGNYVQVWLDAIAGDPVHAFFIEGGLDELLSASEQGGEDYQRSGRGPLSMLANALVWPTAFASGAGAPGADGNWHWVDQKLGAILLRLIVEAQARGVFLFDLLTLDFSATLDSNGDPWDTVTGDFKLPIGQFDLLAAVGRLQAAGLSVRMDPDFTLHAWNDPPARDLSGSVAFAAGVNIREGVTRNIQASPVKSHMLVQGSLDSGALKFRDVVDAAVEAIPAIGRREGYITYQATPTNATLDKAGRKALKRLKRLYDGPTTLPVLDTTGQVALVDYGPWDTVAVEIPDALELAVEVAAVTLTETESGGHEPILSFEETPFDPLLGDEVPKPGTGGTGGGGGTSGGGTGGGGTGGCGECPGDCDECHSIIVGTGPQCTPIEATDWTAGAFYSPREAVPVAVGSTILFSNDGGTPDGIKNVRADIVLPDPDAGDFCGSIDPPPDGNYAFDIRLERDNGSAPFLTVLSLEINIAGGGTGSVLVKVTQYTGGVVTESFELASVNGVDPDVNAALITALTSATSVEWRVRQGPLGTQVKVWSSADPEPAWTTAFTQTLGAIDHEQIVMGRMTEGQFATFRDVRWCAFGTSALYSGIQSAFLLAGTGDGSTQAFTHPGGAYRPGSLHVQVGGTAQPAYEADPGTGAFALGFAPIVGEKVRSSGVPA